QDVLNDDSFVADLHGVELREFANPGMGGALQLRNCVASRRPKPDDLPRPSDSLALDSIKDVAAAGVRQGSLKISQLTCIQTNETDAAGRSPANFPLRSLSVQRSNCLRKARCFVRRRTIITDIDRASTVGQYHISGLGECVRVSVRVEQRSATERLFRYGFGDFDDEQMFLLDNEVARRINSEG